MEKRTVIAVVLSGLIFILYYQFFSPPAKPPVPTPQASSKAAPVPLPAPAVTPLAPAPDARAPVTSASLQGPSFKAEIRSQSGLPTHWWLKEYFVQPNRKGPNIDLLAVSPPTLPMQLILGSEGILLEPYFSGQAPPGAKGLSYQGVVGPWGLTQLVEPGQTDYSAELKLTLENRSSEPQTAAPGVRVTVDQTREAGKGFWIFKEAPNLIFPLFRTGNQVERFSDVQKLGPIQAATGEISWAGLEDRYFLRILLSRVVSPQNQVGYGVIGEKVFTQLQYAPEVIAPGQKKEFAYTLYLGPKDPNLLGKFGAADLGKAIDYGWFGWVALPILYALKFFQSFLYNWGLAIIVLTIVIKILLNPLTKKSMQSMKAMQELQPQLQKMREKYKDDRERLNTETMSLFKTHKVNPMGGCLPMLLQMPIYIALYKVLYNATELYHAPFIGFYHDLSAPDPYFILPILLGVFMVVQQKMSPSMGDPTQAKMMMLMPVMFSLFMLFLPLGLVLYIFVNTVMTVAQQYMHQKKISILGLIRRKT